MKIYQECDINVIITDWLMPNMDGLSLCKKIRSTFNGRYIYIIVLTAKDQKQDLIRVLECGADDYVSKPFDPAELRVRIKTSERIIQLEEGHKLAKETLEKRTNDLRERVKELDCLYGITMLIEKPGISLEEIIQGSYVYDGLSIIHLKNRIQGFYR